VAARHRRPSARLLIATGLLAILGGGLLLGHIWLYTRDARASAGRLTGTLRATMERANGPRGCSASAPSRGTGAAAPRMLLTIPRIGVVAPVLAGTSERVLGVGVGHLTGSRWPDQGGTDVLEAHDVTFFTGLTRLRAGDRVYLDAPCRTWVYRVSAGRVVPQGTPVAAGPTPRLVLVTCWPTDALFYTTQRYLVTTTLVRSSDTASRLPTVTGFPAPKLRLPAALHGVDLSVDTLGIPLGRLHIAGTPSAAWRGSGAPLQASAAGVRLFDAALVLLRRGWPNLWPRLAPGGSASAAGPLRGQPYPVFEVPVDVTVAAQGDRVTGIHLESQVAVAGEPYRLRVTEAARAGWLVISRWSVTPG
jgi:sortase A